MAIEHGFGCLSETVSHENSETIPNRSASHKNHRITLMLALWTIWFDGVRQFIYFIIAYDDWVFFPLLLHLMGKTQWRNKKKKTIIKWIRSAQQQRLMGCRICQCHASAVISVCLSELWAWGRLQFRLNDRCAPFQTRYTNEYMRFVQCSRRIFCLRRTQSIEQPK